jgi:hypothetical protein
VRGGVRFNYEQSAMRLTTSQVSKGSIQRQSAVLPETKRRGRKGCDNEVWGLRVKMTALQSEYDLESECSVGEPMWVRGGGVQSERPEVEGQSAETKKQGTRGRRMQVAMSRTRAAHGGLIGNSVPW